MKWHIDSDGNAFNDLGLIIAPIKKTFNDHVTFEIYLWFPQYDLYDDIAVVDTLREAQAFIKGYATGYNDKIDQENCNEQAD